MNRGTLHSLAQYILNLLHLFLAKVDLSLRCDKIINGFHLLEIFHLFLLLLIFLGICLSHKIEQILVAPKYSIPDYIPQESSQDYSPLHHVLLLVDFLGIESFCDWDYHIWISLDKVLLELIKVLVSSPHRASYDWDIDLVREVLGLTQETFIDYHHSICDFHIHDSIIYLRESRWLDCLSDY